MDAVHDGEIDVYIRVDAQHGGDVRRTASQHRVDDAAGVVVDGDEADDDDSAQGAMDIPWIGWIRADGWAEGE